MADIPATASAGTPAGLAEMRRLISGYALTISVSVVAQLGIADRLAQGPQTAADLAKICGVDADFLRRVLRYLASEGVFEQQAEDRFALTDLSHWLRADVPGSMRPRAAFVGSRISWPVWGHLLQAMQTGKSGMEMAYGKTLFEVGRQDPESAATFNSFMAAQTAASVRALLDAYDFSTTREMVDVGGGRGALVAGVLQAQPQMRGILFDLAEVVSSAPPLLESAGVAERCRIIGGDFFQSVPAGADLYALKFILHDWRDADCVTILKNCRAAMAPGGRVLIIEHLVPEGTGPHFAKFMDINMMVMTDGGRERTQAEFERLLGAAELRLGQVFPTAIGINALECVATG